jgi:hypothetical protein
MIKHLATFAFSEGNRYAELVPDANLITPHETSQTKSFVGWAYCARTPTRDFFLAYFEKDSAQPSTIRGAAPGTIYRALWFDPRTGQWSQVPAGTLRANQWGWIAVPALPSADDWGLKLVAVTNER